MKHAIMIMAHADWPVLRRLVELFDHPDIDIFIHINSRSTSWNNNLLNDSTRYSNVYYAPRIAVSYCNYSQVEAICSLLRTATATKHTSGENFSYYHLISGADLPLKTTRDFLYFFEDNRGKEFVGFDQGYNGANAGYHYIFNNAVRQKKGNIRKILIHLQKAYISLQKILGINLSRGYEGQCKKGSDWWSITHYAALYLLSNEKEFKRNFRFSYCPSELFAQTILYNSHFQANFYDITDANRGSLREIDWQRGTPYVWRYEDKDYLLSSQLMFARKFDRQIDSKIIDAVYQLAPPRGVKLNGDCNSSYRCRRILVVNIGSGLGGIEKSMIEFLNYLTEQGHYVDLYLWRPQGELYDQIPKEVNIIKGRKRPPKRPECHSLSDYLEYLRMHWALIFSYPTKYFKSINNYYDIAISYCQNGYSPYYIIDKVSAYKKMLLYHHGSYIGDSRQKRIDSQYYAKYDYLATVSNANARMIIDEFPKLKDKVCVIENLINPSAIKTNGAASIEDGFSAQSELKLCTVARIATEKGIRLAIETAKCLTQKSINFEWIFVGDGEDRAEIERLISDLDLGERIKLVGAKRNPYPYMSACDIYIQPSLVEAYSITIREAACLNKPIIATEIPAVIEAADRIQNIQIVKPLKDNLARIIIDSYNRMLDGVLPVTSCGNNINDETYNQINSIIQ